jgi:hypothetical protein
MNQPLSAVRRTHRKRQSALRLSSDTTATLPEYTSPIWQRPKELLPEDSPPDYPESAEEADADEDTDSDDNIVVYVPPLSPLPLTSPRRTRRYHHPGGATRRRLTGSTSDLDSLLQRSVHALEMSNALLQSSMSTQSSLSALLASDTVADRSLDRSTRSISTRIRGNGDLHENWMDDLDAITKGVNGLFGEDAAEAEPASQNSADSLVSRSLPISSMPSMSHQQHRRRTSLNLRHAASSDAGPHLHLSTEVDRTELIAPAPRALTMYVDSTDDPDSIVLPSTLGLRTSSSTHHSEWGAQQQPRPPSTMPHSVSASLPVLIDKPSDPSTPAYNLLSSFVTQQQQVSCPGPSNSPLQSNKQLGFTFRKRRGSGSTTSTSTERGASVSGSPSKKRPTHAFPDHIGIRRRGSGSRSRSLTPKRLASPPPRPMTPPIEELSGSSPSSASSDHPPAYRTMECLRKILDDQPSTCTVTAVPPRLKAPAFFPRTPMPVPSFGTSTATASVSRLLTKSIHHSSTRAPSPPKHSSLKRSSAPGTPTDTVSSPTTPTFFGAAGVARMTGSTSSSGRSTPKRISFAELPESYASSRPAGTSRFQEKKNRARNKGKAKAKSQADKAREENGSWWTGWLLGTSGMGNGAGLNFTAQRQEERLEDRAARSWGGRSGFGAMDDWAM